MTKISDSYDVIRDAREAAEQSAARIKLAEQVYDDLSGSRQHGGLSLAVYGDYVIVEDGQDRWLGRKSDFADALTDTLEAVIAGNISDRDGEIEKDAYDHLCCQSGCLYSRIGHGEHNETPATLLRLLGETLDADDVTEIARELGIEARIQAVGGVNFAVYLGAELLGHCEFGSLDADGQYEQDEDEIVEGMVNAFPVIAGLDVQIR